MVKQGKNNDVVVEETVNQSLSYNPISLKVSSFSLSGMLFP